MDQRRLERTLAHEQGHTPEVCYPGEIGHFPEEVEEGLVGGELQRDVWLDMVSRQNDVYNQSVSTEEDSRLGVD